MKVTVIGRRFSETPTYPVWDKNREFPHYDMVEEKTWEIDAETLRDGDNWLAANHPDYYMGGSVVCENGDFSCHAVPCSEYGKGNYETLAARAACIKKLSKTMKGDRT